MKRTHPDSPSYRHYPSLKTLRENFTKIMKIIMQEEEQEEESEHNTQKYGNKKNRNRTYDDVAKKYAQRLHQMNQESLLKQSKMSPSNMDQSFSSSISSKNASNNGTATQLDMDHVYVTFPQFLWAHTFIGPFSYLLWKKNVAWLRIRQSLVNKGLMKVKPMDAPTLVATLCLEQSQVIHYSGRTKDNPDVAVFFFTDFPYVDMNCEYQVASLFTVEINVMTKKMVSAKLDGMDVAPSSAVILLWFNTIAAQHVKLHAMANWGSNVEPSSSDSTDKFFHRNSIVTTVYNYFGYTCFHGYMEEWERQGLLSVGWDSKDALRHCFNHGIERGVWQHSNIDELMKHSKLVNFVVKTRGIFFSEFRKHRHLFPKNVNDEAMFIGTILHSLDHTLMEWNLEDPLWLDVNDPVYGKMAELGRIVRVGFVPDVPGLYFHKRFKGSGHPFYDAVYEKAAKVNRKFADNMDTCIIK